MNSRERVIKTIQFKNPDKIPIELWLHLATILRYGEKLDELLNKYPQDIVRIAVPTDVFFYKESFEVGEYKDVWGSTWRVLQPGMVGEVKIPAIKDITEVLKYRMPYMTLKKDWAEKGYIVDKRIKQAKDKKQFIIAGGIEIFERMQFLRSTENLFYDLGLQAKGVKKLRDKLIEFFIEYIKYLLNREGVDAVMFYDDYGAQNSMLISLNMWREFFKPAYKRLFGIVKDAGKYVFYHSCGHILELYDDLIELGVDAINSQVWCMGIENVAKKCSGRTTIWGEIDRQKILAFGTPQDIYKAAAIMKEKFYVNGGGLIGQSLAGKDVSLINIEALLKCWDV